MAGGRRGHGEGSIHQRADGRWAAVLDLGYQDGKRKRKYFYGATRREVQARLIVAQRDRQQGVPPLGERQTVAQYLTSWLETAKPSTGPRTWERYEELVRLYITPAVGRTRLLQLAPQQVQELMADMQAKGLAPRTVRNMRAVLSRALGEALRVGLVPRNVAAIVRAPKAPRAAMRVYDSDQARQLLEAAKGDRLEALITVALTTGMREGELLGLHWEDVNLDARYLQVQTSLQLVRGKGLVIKDVKTEGSRRKVVLTAAAVDLLRAHRIRQREERLLAGAAWQEGHDLVFCNRFGGPLFKGNMLSQHYRRIIARAGLPAIRFHDLRHTAATLLLLQGINPKIVSEMLGHASVAITLSLYSHVLPDMQRSAADAFDRLLGS